MRLSVEYIAGGDQPLGKRQSGSAQPHFGQGTRRRGHDGPTIRWQFGKQFASARQRHDTFEIGHLAAFDFSILLLMIGVGEVISHGGQTGPAMRLGDDFLWIKSVFKRPFSPYPCHCRSGIN
jgi:hypothetical protein